MSTYKDLQFTPQDFARIHNLNPQLMAELEGEGLIRVIRKKVGNVDRKFITVDDMQEFFRAGRRGDRQGIDVLQPLFGKPEHKVQMFYNIKGGTGKSTLTAQVAMRAALMGFKVLAVDLDGQGHLTLNLDVLDGHERPTVYDILINDVPIEQAIVNVAPGLDLIPANLGLCNIEIPLNQKPRREYRLSEALDRVKDQYDLIIADTNPAASILNSSMLVAAEAVNVVCATNPLAFHGMSLVMSTLEDLIREFRKNLQIRVIPNMYDAREVISQEVLGELKSQLGDFTTDTVVNRSADLNEATKRRASVFEVNSRGTAARDVNRLTRELVFGRALADVKIEQAHLSLAPRVAEAPTEIAAVLNPPTETEARLASDTVLTPTENPTTTSDMSV